LAEVGRIDVMLNAAQCRSGTILTLSASPASLAIGGAGGFAAACAAIEALTRTFAAELGPAGVRVVCLRAQRIIDTLGATPDLPMPVERFRWFLESLTTSKTLPTLDEIARTAVFLAEDGAAIMNGSVVNLTCGMSPD
jgi:3-oxoacyl-[acyl-carrier protein] reductase